MEDAVLIDLDQTECVGRLPEGVLRFRTFRGTSMTLRRKAVGGLVALVCAVGRPVYGQQARTASDHVYSGTQARRGESLYKSRCASCHGEELRGDSGPPLMGAEFLTAWGRQP